MRQSSGFVKISMRQQTTINTEEMFWILGRGFEMLLN
jgi:hypothetical protein